MQEIGETSPATRPKRGWLIALGALGVAGILAVSAVLVFSRLGGGESAGGLQGTPVSSPSQSQTPLPTITSTPRRLEPLKARVLFGVQSVGTDIAKGIPQAYSAAHQPKPKVTSWNKAKNTRGSVVATAKIGSNGNALSKLRAFARLVNDAPRNSVDVALMAFNYQDVSAETDIDNLLQSYSETMESVEKANPDITFLYTTVPVTTSNSWRAIDQSTVDGLGDADQPVWQDNIARERLNTVIRERYGPTGRLFDIAALQAKIGSGKVAAKQHEDHWYYVMTPSLSSDGKQLNKNGSTQLAQALMLLVAAAAKA